MSKKGIEYADKSWNPYSGCRAVYVDRKCAVGINCWAYKMAQRMKGRFGYDYRDPFKPTFHETMLKVPLKRKKPTRWDSCFMGDIAYAKRAWLIDILDVVKRCPQHRFYFLTKQPELLGAKEIEFPENAWIGVTVNKPQESYRIPLLVRQVVAAVHWVSFEPVYASLRYIRLDHIEWIVIGAQTNPTVQPEKSWVDPIIETADDNEIPVFIKPNLTVVEPRLEMPGTWKVA